LIASTGLGRSPACCYAPPRRHLSVSHRRDAAPDRRIDPRPGSARAEAAQRHVIIRELSPCEVHAEGDAGYQAGDPTSGSRLNSRLKNTPASESPFTQEFLADIAATNRKEMLSYATNIESASEALPAGFNHPLGRDSTGGDDAFRVRGIGGGVSRDFVDAFAPNDLDNVARAEISIGPRSTLCGLGPAGDLGSITGKKRHVRHTQGRLAVALSQDNYQRTELGQNLAILRKNEDSASAAGTKMPGVGASGPEAIRIASAAQWCSSRFRTRRWIPRMKPASASPASPPPARPWISARSGSATTARSPTAPARWLDRWLDRPFPMQLNGTNLTNADPAGAGRYNTADNGMLRVYLGPPHIYQLTTAMKFFCPP
jgi:hypothetical protein